MRLVDADSLLTYVHSLACETNDMKTKTIVENVLHVTVPEIIKDEPTIDAQPVKYGRWVYVETIGGMKHYYCTICKELDADNECCADENQILWFKFCPKCGARMEVDEDGDQV